MTTSRVFAALALLAAMNDASGFAAWFISWSIVFDWWDLK